MGGGEGVTTLKVKRGEIKKKGIIAPIKCNSSDLDLEPKGCYLYKKSCSTSENCESNFNPR